MSIGTLKRKSMILHARYKKSSTVSLNGTTRQPPHTLGRPITRTPFKGPDPIGHGGGSRCLVGGRYARICGNGYTRTVSTGFCTTPQTTIKTSTISSSGYQKRFNCSKPIVMILPEKKSCREATPSIIYNHVKTERQCTPHVKNLNIMSISQYSKCR